MWSDDESVESLQTPKIHFTDDQVLFTKDPQYAIEVEKPKENAVSLTQKYTVSKSNRLRSFCKDFGLASKYPCS
jgi:hypothetical protein